MSNLFILLWLEAPLQSWGADSRFGRRGAGEFTEALQSPVWDIYFGRKCCAPTDLVFRECFESEAAALDAASAIAAEKSLREAFRVRDYAQGDESAGEVVALNNVPVQFGTRKKYRERRVTIIHQSDEE